MSDQPEERSHGEAAPAPAPGTRTAGDRRMLRATLVALVAGLVLDVIVIAVAVAAFEGPAVLGALIGTGLTLVVVLPTVLTVYLAPRLSPLAMAVITLASWALKMVIVVVVLIVLRNAEQVAFAWVGLALLVGALTAIAIEVFLLSKVRRPLDTAVSASGTDGPEAP